MPSPAFFPARTPAFERPNFRPNFALAPLANNLDTWAHSYSLASALANLTSNADSCRSPQGFEICAATLADNSSSLSGALTRVDASAAASAGSNLGIQSFAAWGNVILGASRQSSAYTSPIYRCSDGILASLSQTGVGACAGLDSGDHASSRNLVVKRDPNSGYLFFGASPDGVSLKTFSSTNDGVTWTARTTVSSAPFNHSAFAAAHGFFCVPYSINAGNFGLRWSNDLGATWNAVIIATQTASEKQPVAIGFSYSLGCWLLVCSDLTVYRTMGADPDSAWTTLRAAPTTGQTHVACLADSLVAAVRTSGTYAEVRISGDLGLTWRSINLGFRSGTVDIGFSGARIHVVTNGFRYVSNAVPAQVTV